MTSERVIDMNSETMIDFVGIPNLDIAVNGCFICARVLLTRLRNKLLKQIYLASNSCIAQ